MRAGSAVRWIGTVSGALGLAAAVGGPPAAAQDVTVVAKGLDNPRGLAFGPGGALYVTESGRGGRAPCVQGPEGDQVCFGQTGALTRVDLRGARQTRVLRRLPSLANRDGSDAIGASDIAFSGRTGYLTVGLGANPAVRSQLGAGGRQMAKLYRMRSRGRPRAVANLGTFEATRNPDAGQPGAEPDTNPNAVLSTRGGRVVVDAGGNDLLSVSPRGAISLLALFPFATIPAPDEPGFPVPPGTPFPVQPVPTSVVRGPDGAYYVGQLTGFPFPPGTANVWRVAPGSPPEVYASGFTTITDLAFGPDGSLYVLQFATSSIAGPPSPGALIRVGSDGSRTELAAGRLSAATGLVLDGRYAYVSNRGAEPRVGEVLRIPLTGP
jgi:hypothetical protein